MAAPTLNYHHLRYFWRVALDGQLTRVARELRVSQSALSAQIRQLEDQLGEPLFDRVGRRLELTEAGRIALAHARVIFDAGDELVATLTEARERRDVLRIAAVATLSRNFQESFVRPLFEDASCRVELRSGALADLLPRLVQHELDLVLSNRPATTHGEHRLRCRRVARQQVSVVGHADAAPLRFPDDLGRVRFLLPSAESETRTAFDALCDALGVRLDVRAEVDDMALLRLLARDMDAVALLPSVVVRDELSAGLLREHFVVPDVYESFYAILPDRRFPHPRVESLLARDAADLLATPSAPRA